MCHESSYIDFSEFSSALIVGKVENNELFSNGVGKTTIFKAIEYVLFNQSDSNLDKIIRDDEPSCKICLNFYLGAQEYRVTRSRSKKGSTDLSLFERNGALESDDTYHKIISSKYGDLYSSITSDKYWKDISGRRAADTEKDLAKLLKINFKSFRSTVHFMQNDFSGLTTATPEKRKGILKEALNLAIYSKLEKIAKEKANLLSKEIDRSKTLLENLGDPNSDILSLSKDLSKIEDDLKNKNILLSGLNENLSSDNDILNALVSDHSISESKCKNLLQKEKTISSEKERIESSLNDYLLKKSNVIKAANDLIKLVSSQKEELKVLEETDFSHLDSLNEEIASIKDMISQHYATIKINLSKIEELKIPLPNDSSCKHCRQPLSEEHIKICQNDINNQLSILTENNSSLKKKIIDLNSSNVNKQEEVKKILEIKTKIDSIKNNIISKNKEISDKKELHSDYVKICENLKLDLASKNLELENIKEDLKNSSQDETIKISEIISRQKEKILKIKEEITSLNKEITNDNSQKAVIEHNISQKNNDLLKKKTLTELIEALNSKYLAYPSVLQAFSSTGIPNLIIQNVLDDLQIEANNLLTQLKPGLQLSFFIEKTKSDGTEADTLDIIYSLNGKEREYDQLSGAQKLAVTFSLKLGLSFLLQKMIGTDIKFLLLDEIDQSLDKASVDAFADIVKFFQKDYTILIITHNDRLKDKFSHAICVEQDINMISRAKVVSSW